MHFLSCHFSPVAVTKGKEIMCIGGAITRDGGTEVRAVSSFTVRRGIGDWE